MFPGSPGSWFDGDGEPELLELVDEVALASGGVVEAGEIVGSHLLVGDVVVQDVPDHDEKVVGDGDGCFLGAAALAKRRNRTCIERPESREARQPASISADSSHGSPGFQ